MEVDSLIKLRKDCFNSSWKFYILEKKILYARIIPYNQIIQINIKIRGKVETQNKTYVHISLISL